MHCRITRILVLGFACLWFGVLAPVHERGRIPLPGAAGAGNALAARGDTASHACCPTGPARLGPTEADGTAAPGAGQRECPASTGSCAVCYFIATLDLPPPVTLVPEQGGAARPSSNDLPVARPSLPPQRLCRDRGPPLA